MIVKISAEMMSSVGTITTSRQRMYRSMLVASAFKPKRVRHVDAEIAGRIETIEPLGGNIPELRRNNDRLERCIDDADGKYIVGIKGEHAVPDLRTLFGRRGQLPLIIELHEFVGGVHVRGRALFAASLVVHPPLWPLQLAMRYGSKVSRVHVGSGDAIIDAGPDRYHGLTSHYAAAEKIDLARADEKVDADRAPVIGHELEHVRFCSTLARRFD